MSNPARQDLRRFFADHHVDLTPVVERVDQPFDAMRKNADRLPQPRQDAFDALDGLPPDRPMTGAERASYWSAAISTAAARGLAMWHARKFIVPEVLADDPAARRNAAIEDLKESIDALLVDLDGTASSASYRAVEVEQEQIAAKALLDVVPLVEALRRSESITRKNPGTRREDVFRTEFLAAMVETWRIAVGQPTFTAHAKARAGTMSFVDFAEIAWEQVLGFPASGGKFRSAIEKIAQRKSWTKLPPSAFDEKSALTEF